MKLCKVEGCDKEVANGSDYCRYHQVENCKKISNVGKVAATICGVALGVVTILSKKNK
ncbi:MAG: hypothetical protein E6100_07150 [Clostridium perfringens]|uniref:hypothetical protein n=1 Tax=Clostridium perfringens TaxID=1502 RepID=UPI0028551D73|nr:hypothetical protein [Clostridium perfringens]MDK0745286.1 hypothetical protein [Clostridium perfringens]MDK0754057.1 hypothetical protein [Clostridium perfringens]MDK0757236.1 hypothetical protein [Clostridium perfringens]MDK0905335.1 hypothetical protein [Clostridium perfringens]